MTSISVTWESSYSLNLVGSQADLILSTAQGAADNWAKYLQGDGVIDIALGIGNVGDGNILATGGPRYAWNGQEYVFASILEAREGYDGNGSTPEGTVTISQLRLGDLFYDPQGEKSVPVNKIDAYALLQHEISHVLGFIEFIATTEANGTLTFSGDNTNTVFGKAVVIDNGRAHILGDEDLMDPFSPWGERPRISDLDLAMLQDKGLPIATERADHIWLGDQSDTFSAFGGNDRVDGGLGDDFIYGGAGNDSLNGGLGSDHLFGGDGTDSLFGDSNADKLNGKAGADTLIGGAGSDTYYVDNAGDVVVEAANQGTDRVVSQVSYVLSDNVENLSLGTSAALSGTGNALANVLVGNRGANVLDGKVGADTLTGRAGADTFLFRIGETQGDKVTDFTDAGSASGDHLEFRGFGTGATLTHAASSDVYTITADAAHGSVSETFQLVGVTNLDLLTGMGHNDVLLFA